VINEVLGSTTTDDVEFIELLGEPGLALTGLSLVIVEGDNGNSKLGNFDRRIDFGAADIIGDDGLFLIGNTLVQGEYGVTPDFITDPGENFVENSAYTIALVETSTITGSSATGGETVIDAVGVADPGGSNTFFFNAPVVGPDGSFLPAGFRRVPDGSSNFELADFFLGPGNTPGEFNDPSDAPSLGPSAVPSAHPTRSDCLDVKLECPDTFAPSLSPRTSSKSSKRSSRRIPVCLFNDGLSKKSKAAIDPGFATVCIDQDKVDSADDFFECGCCSSAQEANRPDFCDGERIPPIFPGIECGAAEPCSVSSKKSKSKRRRLSSKKGSGITVCKAVSLWESESACVDPDAPISADVFLGCGACPFYSR